MPFGNESHDTYCISVSNLLEMLTKDVWHVIAGMLPYDDFLRWRQACKKFYEWSVLMHAVWFERLALAGPKTIGPGSVHMPFQCSKGSTCRAPRHFVASTLVARVSANRAPYVQVVLSAMKQYQVYIRRQIRCMRQLPQPYERGDMDRYERARMRQSKQMREWRAQWWQVEYDIARVEQADFLRANSKLKPPKLPRDE